MASLYIMLCKDFVWCVHMLRCVGLLLVLCKTVQACLWPAMMNYSADACVCVPGYIAVDNVTSDGTACKIPCPKGASCVMPPEPLKSYTFENWTCPICATGTYGGDSAYDAGWPETSALLAECDRLSFRHRTLAPVLIDNACCKGIQGECSVSNVCTYCYTEAHVVCEEGFYDTQGPPGWPECEVCPSLRLETSDGFYQPRCSARIEPCVYPPLGPNEEYGMADPFALPPDCSEAWPYGTMDAECAFYQTPLYALGACQIMCRVGSFWNGSACADCDLDCAPGEEPPPECTARALAAGPPLLTTGACQVCNTELLPAHAHFARRCDWTCEKGMYRDDTQCVPCSNDVSCVDGSRYMHCTGRSPGQCVQCGVLSSDCTLGWTYLYTGVDAETCECRLCTPHVAGWVRQTMCTLESDATWRPCTPCVDGQTYVAWSCTDSQDTYCATCQTVPTDQLLLSACNRTHDTVYVPCPTGFACNGSAHLRTCEWPEVLEGAHCVCGTGYVRDDGGGCAVMRCEGARYPTLQGTCEPCFTEANAESVEAIVLPDTFGREACVCPDSTYAVGEEGCWPEGTLDCDTLGRVQVGHECICFVPWAAHTVNAVTCAYECNASHTAQLSSTAVGRPHLYPSANALWSLQLEQGTVILGATAQPAVLLLADNRLLLLEKRKYEPCTALLGDIDTSLMRDIQCTALAPHEEHTLWVGFTYTGWCEPREGGGDPAPDLFCTNRFVYDTDEEKGVWALSDQLGYSAYGGIHAMMDGALAQFDGTTLYVVHASSRRLLWSAAGTRAVQSLVVVQSTMKAFGSDGQQLYQWSCTDTQWTLQRTWGPVAAGLYPVDSERVGLGLDGWLDMRNNMLMGSSAPAVVAAHGDRRLVATDTAALYVALAACPPDYHAYADACVPMPCVRSEPYGAGAWRDGTCKPGHANQQACEECPLSFYCVNGTRAQACPLNAVTKQVGAVGLRDCECKAGYYSYGTSCMPCDTFSWCPGGGIPPIPCANGGSTSYAASRSPLQCRCPPRTYGLDCKPCPDHAICAPPLVPPAVLYVVLSYLSPDPSLTIARPDGGGWYVVLSLPASSSVPPDAYDSARCPGTSAVCSGVSVLQPCGPHFEWNGEVATTLQRCTCIGGYALGEDNACEPCVVGTVRQAHSEWSECVPCSSNASLHAPYAGMTACVCSEATDVITGDCLPRRSASPLEGQWVTNPTMCISITASVATMVLLLTLVLPHRR